MTNQNLFDKKHIATITADRRDLLEELNLPPKLAGFLRQNKRAIQIGAVCLALAMVLWAVYDHYSESQRQEAAARLATALKISSVEQRVAQLKVVATEYSGSEAAIWSRIELAHLAREQGENAEARREYKAVLADLDDNNPAKPMVLYALAQTQEAAGEFDLALATYDRVAQYSGFANPANIAIGRISEAQGDTDKALAAYRQVTGVAASGPVLEKVTVLEHSAAAGGN